MCTEEKQVATENQENGYPKRTDTRINIVQRMMERKLHFFGHTCRMQDDRLVKQVVFGTMDGENKRGRHERTWTDDIVALCNNDICTLYGIFCEI